MAVLEELSTASSTYNIAITVIVISIILSGIAIGVGKAIRSRRLELFGREELIQSVINSALIGGLFIITTTMNGALLSLTPQAPAAMCPSIEGNLSSAAGYVECNLVGIESGLHSVNDLLIHSNYVIAFVSKIELNMAIVSSQPFFSLEWVAQSINSFLQQLYFFSSLVSLQITFIAFIISAAFPVLLPTGLILRCFFATRRIGGAIMAMAIGFYVVYPLMFTLAFNPTPYTEKSTLELSQTLTSFNNRYSSVPLVDIGEENIIQEKINELSKNDFVGEVNALLDAVPPLISDLAFVLIVIPLISAVITIVFILELATLLGSEIAFKGFDLI